MTFGGLFSKWNLTSVRLNVKFAEIEFCPNDDDRQAAWELYVELITRITTQKLPDTDGDEKTALESIHGLFQITRGILKERGRTAPSFSRISIIMLNQVVRPFTAKWHRVLINGDFSSKSTGRDFRTDLKELQGELIDYTKLLAEMAEVEDMTILCDD